MRKEKKIIAHKTLLFTLGYRLKKYLIKKRLQKKLNKIAVEQEIKLKKIEEFECYLGVCATRICRVLRRYQSTKLTPLAQIAYKNRCKYELSVQSRSHDLSGSSSDLGSILESYQIRNMRNTTDFSVNNAVNFNSSGNENDCGNNDNGNHDIRNNENRNSIRYSNDDNYNSNDLYSISSHQNNNHINREKKLSRSTYNPSSTFPQIKLNKLPTQHPSGTSTLLFKSNSNSQNKTPLFKAVLDLKTVFCSSNFSDQNFHFLFQILSHPSCQIENLIFQNIKYFDSESSELNFLSIIKNNRSLKTVKLLSGKYSENFVTKLLDMIQVENPRVIGLFIEGIEKIFAKKMAVELSLASGRLLSDYFNYSLPGVRTLCLHGTYLQDVHVRALSEALMINTTLQELILSRNLITDIGLISLFQGYIKNEKSSLRLLDLNCNFIKCSHKVRALFESYRVPVKRYLEIKFVMLEIFLYDNMIPLSEISFNSKFMPSTKSYNYENKTQLNVHFIEIVLTKNDEYGENGRKNLKYKSNSVHQQKSKTKTKIIKFKNTLTANNNSNDIDDYDNFDSSSDFINTDSN